jgi:prevent-host-death family protein
MRDVQASDVKDHLPQILDAIERGETVRITRDGQPVARIVPEERRRKADVDQAIENIKARRKLNGRVTVEEILSLRDEGRKY